MCNKLVIFFLLLSTLFLFATACEKEYSYEGGPDADPAVPDSLMAEDSSSNTTTLSFTFCQACATLNTSELYWTFRINNIAFCGTVTNTVVSPERDALTFFGPSICSPDSGLIITAFFEANKLSNNLSNLQATRASLEYYDNIGGTDVLASKRPHIFNMRITEYVQQTGIATGTFGGLVLTKNGEVVKVDDGRFTIKF